MPRFRFDYGPVVLAGTPPPLGGGVRSYAPRRTISWMPSWSRPPRRAGAEVRPAFRVDGVLADGGRVAGIRGAARGGAALTERARLVVGADGRRSLVARAVAAPAYRARPALTCAYYAYWDGVLAEGVIEGYFLPRRVILVFPTNDGQVCVFLQWPRAEFGSVRADAEGHLWAAVAQVPGLAGRLHSQSRRAARLEGTGDLPNFFRTPYGPGWALAGDTGYHRDPLTAQGMSDAFRDAQLLSEAIDAHLAGRQPLAGALAGYQRQRDQAATAMYELTCQRAALEPPAPQMSRAACRLCTGDPGRHRPVHRRHRRHGPDRGVLRTRQHPAHHRRQHDRLTGNRNRILPAPVACGTAKASKADSATRTGENDPHNPVQRARSCRASTARVRTHAE